MPFIKIDIQTPFSGAQVPKATIAGTMTFLDDRFDTIDVSPDQTMVTWNRFFSGDNSVSGIGTGLMISGVTLTGGTFTSFTYQPGTGAAVISNLNIDAVVLQGLIDDVNAGGTNSLVDEIFDNHRQKINGSDGDDILDGGHKADTIKGHAGNDIIVAGEGDDKILGGPGTDRLEYSDNSILGKTGLGMLGGVTIDLKAGTATIGSFHHVVHGVEDLALTDSADNCSGDYGGNFLSGDAGNDRISGRGGNDTIDGGPGDDVLIGNGGNDQISGGDGNDTIHGNGGNDDLFGESKNDRILGDSGNDFISGLDGFDTLIGGADNDTIVGGAQDDMIKGGSGRDYLQGEDGNDTVYGGSNKDLIVGGSGEDSIYGGVGADRLIGQGQADKLFGSNGNDKLSGGSGNDLLVGQGGHDTETGGKGADTFNFLNFGVSQGSDTITDFTDVDNIHIAEQPFSFVLVEQLIGGDALINYSNGNIVLESIDVAKLSINPVGLDVVIILL